eukprot:TRINITY_DN87620_c0_g1_i1.p1 TRINITY_DN87620_c0_g1~~TRINITY_DN87620_c0_g1_i1.p1  ORF type:complete len:494 (-),score=123.97 TRINITY_DN87620_c0_g1_i1:119-1531(-)
MADEGAEEYKKKGNDAFAQKSWDEAIKNYNKAIQLDPKQAAYYSNRAACLSSKGDHNSALNDANKCIELDPNFVKGYSRKGKALFDLRRWDEAEAAYQAGLGVDPENKNLQSGLAEVEAGRNRANRPSSSSGSSSFGFGGAGGIGGMFNNILGKFKRGGLGGRMQMYLVVFAGYYIYKNFINKQTPGTDTASDEQTGPEMDDDDTDRQATSSVLTLKRGFKEISGHWLGYLEAESQASTMLLMLHRSSLSAEAEFGKTIPSLLEEASKSTPATSLRLLAPDRPCHGYSPCSTSAASDVKWLHGLLRVKGKAKSMAYVASGREASQMVLNLVRQRKESAQILLVSPSTASGADAASWRKLKSAADVGTWIKNQDGLRTAADAAEAVRWAAAAATKEEKGNEASGELDVKGLPDGSTVSILTAADEVEDKGLMEELETQGVVVRTQQASGQSNYEELVVTEALQLIQAPADA